MIKKFVKKIKMQYILYLRKKKYLSVKYYDTVVGNSSVGCEHHILIFYY